jgi:hypothetical protein
VFYLTNDKDGTCAKPSENTGGMSKWMEASTDDKKRMEEFGIKLINAILSEPKRSDALTVFNSWQASLEKVFWAPLPKTWNNIMKSILGELTCSPHIYDSMGRSNIDKAWGKIEFINMLNTALSQIKTPTKTVGPIANTEIPKLSEPEQKKADFIKKYKDIDTFKQTIFKYTMEHPRLSEQSSNSENLIAQARQALSQAGSTWLEGYNAVLQTIESVVRSKAFWWNTGSIKEIFANQETKERRNIFESTFKELLNTAIKTWKPQSIDGFNNKDFKGISLEEEQKLNASSPEKLFGLFVTMLKSGELKKEQILAYINGLSGTVKPILAKLSPDNPLQKQYENKFTQMRALAQNPILHDGWATFGGMFNGNTLDKFIWEVEKSSGKDGSIWYDKGGNFKFYSIEEMRTDIMRDGKIEGTVDVAWDAYIKWTGGDISKLAKIFWEDWLNALAIYLKDKKDSSLINGDIWAKFYIWLQSYYTDHINDKRELTLWKQEWKEMRKERIERLDKKTLEKDFPNLHALIASSSIDLNNVAELPRTKNGGIDGITLIYNLIRDKNTTPEQIQSMLTALEADFRAMKEQHKKEKQETVEELKLKYPDWKSICTQLDIPKSIQLDNGGKSETLYIEWLWPIGGNRTPEQQNALIRELEKKLNDPNTTPEQKQDIEKLMKLVWLDKKHSNADKSAAAITTASAKDMRAASDKWLDAEKKTAAASNAHANSIVEKERTKENSENTKNIPWIQELYAKYGLPFDIDALAKPVQLKNIEKAISDLQSKWELSDIEKMFLNQLYEAKNLIRSDARAVTATYELAQSYPEFSETVNNIKEHNEVVRNTTPAEVAAYLYIDSPYSLSPSATLIAHESIGGKPRNIGDIAKDKPFSKFTKAGTVQRTGTAECQIMFQDSPTGRHLDAVNGIPISGFDSFLIQAELYSKLWLHALIPLIPAINREISEKTGKKTDFADGKFDIQEIRRNLQTLSVSLLGMEITGQESIDELKKKIATKYPAGQKEIESRLIEKWILRREGWYSQAWLEKAIWQDI